MPTHETEAEASALVARWIEAFNTHNVDAIVGLYAESAELYDSGMKRPRQGRADIEQWFTTRFRAMPSLRYTPTSQLFEQEQAVVFWTAQGQTPRLLRQPWLARAFQVDGVSHFIIRDGRIQKQRGYYDHLAIVERVLPPLKWLPSRL
ncbi:MAG: nuclear transport factor 2 family protein [Ktedonobacteraceae bacterium]|nr:nuclear transport factor 2 family protein [Ktedonobacteraceae bacterium]